MLFADAGYAALLEAQALQPLLTAATATAEQSGQWQGALPLAALAALCRPESSLRSQVLQSTKQLLPRLLEASVGSSQHEHMLIGVLHMLKEQLQTPGANDATIASGVVAHLLNGMQRLTKVSIAPRQDNKI